jgi:hypothetical protein
MMLANLPFCIGVVSPQGMLGRIAVLIGARQSKALARSSGQ